MQLHFYEDNTAAIQILSTGKNPTLRHLGRTHRVDLAWLHEVFAQQSQIDLSYCKTDQQAADIFTKVFISTILWRQVLRLISVYPKAIIDHPKFKPAS